MTWSGCLALVDVRKWSGGPPRCSGVVRKPFRMAGRGREAHPVDQEWSGAPDGCPRMVERPFWMSGSGREALLDVW